MNDRRSNTSVFNVRYHLIRCPKYRRKVLIGKVKTRLQELLNKKAKERDISIEKMEIMPDYILLFVKASPHKIVQQFKGYSSRLLRQEFKSLKSRLPTLWTRSYYCENIGYI